jgi:hypothetical protein
VELGFIDVLRLRGTLRGVSSGRLRFFKGPDRHRQWVSSCDTDIEIAEGRVFDLPHIVTHPLLASIFRRHAVLMEQAKGMAAGSSDRKAIERRISLLEQYRLPKPHPEEQMTVPITDQSGTVIAEESSLRRRRTTVRIPRNIGSGCARHLRRRSSIPRGPGGDWLNSLGLPITRT